MRAQYAVALVLAGQSRAQLPRSDEWPRLNLPDYPKEVPAAGAEQRQSISWHSYPVNAVFGGDRREGPGGFLDRRWLFHAAMTKATR